MLERARNSFGPMKGYRQSQIERCVLRVRPVHVPRRDESKAVVALRSARCSSNPWSGSLAAALS